MSERARRRLRISLQFSTDLNSLLNLIVLLVELLLVYWIVTTLRRMDKTLQDVKKKIEAVTRDAAKEGNQP